MGKALGLQIVGLGKIKKIVLAALSLHIVTNKLRALSCIYKNIFSTNPKKQKKIPKRAGERVFVPKGLSSKEL
jgi:hypothetical protein